MRDLVELAQQLRLAKRSCEQFLLLGAIDAVLLDADAMTRLAADVQATTSRSNGHWRASRLPDAQE